MAKYKQVNGIKIQLTTKEELARKAEEVKGLIYVQNEQQEKQDAINKKASGKQKLLDLGLSEEEVKALIGI